MKREHRAVRQVEIRATEVDGKPGVTLHCIKPGVVDDYGSVWMPDTFDESLKTRMPTLCWAHDWSEPLGPGVDYKTSDDGPEVAFTFSDFEAVPLARRAHAQVMDGTIQDCSVGFSNVKRRDPTDAELKQYPGVSEIITKADLDEVSLVLRGAVPGAKVLAVRAAGGVVDEELVISLGRKVAAGELTQDEAKATLALAAEEPPETDTSGVAEAVDAELTEIEADVDAVLASLTDRSRANG